MGEDVSDWDVMAKLLAHCDRGDGHCDECHEVHPCEMRLYYEAELHERNRGRR